MPTSVLVAGASIRNEDRNSPYLKLGGLLLLGELNGVSS